MGGHNRSRMPILSSNTKGAIFMVVSMAAFTINDAFIKVLTETLPLMQTIATRGVFVTAALAAIAWKAGGFHFREIRESQGLVATRVLAEMAATVSFLTALMYLPLANCAAILQFAPLALTMAGAFFLGEKVGWRRWMAILLGFAGVMMIIRPGTDEFSAHSLLVLVTVLAIVVRDIVTRQIRGDIPSGSIAMVTAVSVTAMGFAALPAQPWAPIGPGSWILIVSTSGFLVIGYLFLVMAMRAGEISFVSPFRYTTLVWGIALGALVFGHWPDSWTLAGSLIVVLTGIYTLYREHALGLRGD